MKKMEYIIVAILFFVLIAVTSAMPNLFMYGFDLGINYGFPFNFYGYGGGPNLTIGQPVPQYFNVLSLVADILVWLIVAFLIFLLYSKFKKK